MSDMLEHCARCDAPMPNLMHSERIKIGNGIERRICLDCLKGLRQFWMQGTEIAAQRS
jgi:hypothetical protein